MVVLLEVTHTHTHTHTHTPCNSWMDDEGGRRPSGGLQVNQDSLTAAGLQLRAPATQIHLLNIQNNTSHRGFLKSVLCSCSSRLFSPLIILPCRSMKCQEMVKTCGSVCFSRTKTDVFKCLVQSTTQRGRKETRRCSR